jgi:hypothetical protein
VFLGLDWCRSACGEFCTAPASMGIVSSKDETGAVVATSLRGQDILDYEGRDLRDKMDVCLSKYMWYWTLGATYGPEPGAGSESCALPCTSHLSTSL